MKLKALAILAVSSLFAATFALAAPTSTVADDSPAMSGSNNGSMSGNIGAVGTNNDMQPQGAGSSVPGTGDTGSTSDDMSADTATGDDDY